MGSRLHQLEVVFDPIQDRLILKFQTETREEYRLWITRRFIKLLWATLKNILYSLPKSSDPIKQERKLQEESQKVTEAYEREKEMKDSDFVKKYSTGSVEISTTPLGTEPILVSRIQIKRGESEIPILCLHPEIGQGFEISANSMIIYALCKLLSEAVTKTDWDLSFDY